MRNDFGRSVLRFVAAAGAMGWGMAYSQDSICTQTAVAPLTRPQPSSIEGSTAYVYKPINGANLRLHVFKPLGHRASDKLPAIVFFFGGGWLWGNVADGIAQAKYLAGRGMVAILADYRVYCRNQVDVTEEMADAKSAIRWVRSHARTLGIDPNRIAASGASSGGHLALGTVGFEALDEPGENRKNSSKPNALVLYFPCVDASTEEERKYSSAPLGEHGKDVSPLYHIGKGLPPMIIHQGTADSLYASVSQYCSEVRAAGGECEFVEYQDAPHGFFNPAVNHGNAYREALAGTDRFLTKLGYLPRAVQSGRAP